MSRPTRIQINPRALLHNLGQVRLHAPTQAIFAMVKANAYGCGIDTVIPVLDGQVDLFGVACLKEALAIQKLGATTPCLLIEGVFSQQEWSEVSYRSMHCAIHHQQQLKWLLEKELPNPVTIWMKVNTGMHRLGFEPSEVDEVLRQLQACSWVKKPLGLMTHFACADEPHKENTLNQIQRFNDLGHPSIPLLKSLCNSAGIINFKQAHADAVRPGIMLYGISPCSDQTGLELGLQPVMQFVSKISAIRHYPTGASIGYGATYQTTRPSIIGIVPVGYGDGYPRHIAPDTPVWIKNSLVPIVGRVSMDMLTIDLTDCAPVALDDPVELWGSHLPIEHIAKSAGTIAYELICQLTERVRTY